METDQVGRLRDILKAARLIGSYVKDTTRRISTPTKKNKTL
jgi:hypothetical protein